jgi:hypothetical protein
LLARPSAAVTTRPKKLTYMMMRTSAKGEVTSTLPPVPKSTDALDRPPPDMSTNRKPSPKNTRK